MAVLVAEIFTSTLPKPAKEITSVLTVEGTVNLKEPSAPVWVPVEVPLATTDAPESGDPSFESVTLPVTVFVCACEKMANRQAKAPNNMGLASSLRFINGSLLVIKRVQNTHFLV